MKKKCLLIIFFLIVSIFGINTIYATDTHDLTIKYEEKGNTHVDEDFTFDLQLSTYDININGNLTIIDVNGKETTQAIDYRTSFHRNITFNNTNDKITIKGVPTGVKIIIHYRRNDAPNDYYYLDLASSNAKIDLSSFNRDSIEESYGTNTRLNFEKAIESEDDNISITIGSLSGNYEKKVPIQIKQELENLEIKEGMFTYSLRDLDDNIIQTTTNDKDGNVIFDKLVVSNADAGAEKMKFFKIVQEVDQKQPFTFDQYVIYVTVTTNYSREGISSKIAFYKDDDVSDEIKNNVHYKREIFHATEEELQGQAYAVLDYETGVLTFFRDERNKYTNRETIGNKVYYTGFEEKTEFHEWQYSYDIKEIIFKDAIKPLGIEYWFEYLYNVEKVDLAKLDTSLITSLNFFFADCPKLESLDISTMDVKNVQGMTRILNGPQLTYLDFTAWNLDTSLNFVSVQESVSMMPKLRYLNISNFGNWSTSAEFSGLQCLEKIEIGDQFDFYRSSLSGAAPDMWYNPVTKELTSIISIRNKIIYDHASVAGYYIRPSCNYEASFRNIYNAEDDTEGLYTSTKLLQNPETRDLILVFLIALVLSLIVLYNLEKRKIELV